MIEKKENKGQIGILTFEPIFRTVRWGGVRLAEFKNLPTLPNDSIGESWEISGVRGEETKVAKGPFAGLTITEMLERYGKRIMGERLYGKFGDFFPLLIKFIDAQDDLSIQVHPDDDKAPDGHGKTELWYIIDSKTDSYIYSGFKNQTDRKALSEMIAGDAVEGFLNKHYGNPGDVYYLPAGCVHSIGAGNLILEVQQTSEITYRLYDYNRRDKDGNLRELHIEEALEAIDYNLGDTKITRRPEIAEGRESYIARVPYFTVTVMNVSDEATLDVKALDSPRIIVAVEGKGFVRDSDGNSEHIAQGRTILVPAETESVIVKAEGEPLKIISIYIE